MKTRFYIIMGVSGSGKTEVGKALAQYLGWDFYDADDFHPAENIAKMTSGIPLDDADRAPWLAKLHSVIVSALNANQPGVLACSAIKERYRQQLADGTEGVQIVYLKGTYDLIWARMSARKNHFMKPAMLQSQYDVLEEPANALIIDVSTSIDDIVQKIINTTA